MKRLTQIFSILAVLVFTPNDLSASSETLFEGAEVSQGPSSLRDNIIVSGAYIRLGDLFTNVPVDKAETAVAYAPKPGRRAAFDARWLFRVARAYQLEWRPLSKDLRAMVTRDSIVIDTLEIKDAVMASLVSHNLPDNPRIELSNRQMRIHVPTDIMPEVSVEDITFNQRSQRFAAIVSVGEKNMGTAQRVRVTGQVHQMIDVPTLSRRIAKGEVIAQNDIEWVQMRADRTQRDVIIDAEKLVGMTPKRHLRADTPIRASDVQRPVLVGKGDIVTIILKKPGMTLTSQGRALQNGADGDVVRITNTNTSRTIDAIVVGANIVTVIPTGFRTTELAFNN